MSGRLRETDYASVKERRESPQSYLADWCDDDETFIAVVRRDGGTDITAVCDEHHPELGMPGYALSRFLETRAGYRTNSAVDDAHNKAFEDCDLEEIYRNHLETRHARDAVRELANRLADGENITLVCFETGADRCHRHILLEEIERQVEEREQSDFKFVVPS